jgi:hypothetical protein
MVEHGSGDELDEQKGSESQLVPSPSSIQLEVGESWRGANLIKNLNFYVLHFIVSDHLATRQVGNRRCHCSANLFDLRSFGKKTTNMQIFCIDNA